MERFTSVSQIGSPVLSYFYAWAPFVKPLLMLLIMSCFDLYITILAIFSILKVHGTQSDIQFDKNGYILYCPCMGRYGNQADHFLGSIAFAKGLNRTLVLPPWRTYKNIPFSEFFEVSPLRKYHRVMLMEEFLEKIAPKYWPVGKRIGYCWLPPQSTVKCTLKEGNPFQQFWDELGVDFDGYMSHHLSFDVEDHYNRKEWDQTFPPSSYPVLALRGAPARYPIIENHRHIQRYLKWSPVLLDQANKIIIELLPKGPFVGIHLRNGLDWENACRHVEGLPNFMASPQCLGYTHYRKLTKEICFPSKREILNRTKAIVESIKATTVYVATDNDPMLSDLKAVLLEYKTSVVHANPRLPQIDLIILAKSDFFIGNCVSSFTAHVKRERDVHGLPSAFWGYHEK